MKSRNAIFFILIGAVLMTGCVGETNSALNDDPDVHPDFVKPAAAIDIRCPETAMVFLLASSEGMSRIDSWNIDDPTQADVEKKISEGNEKFAAAIKSADSDLTQALTRDPLCMGESGNAGVRTEMVYVSVIDGPGQNDSKIKSMHFKYEGTSWKRSSLRKWKYVNNQLTALPKGIAVVNGVVAEEEFELDMSRDAAAIAGLFASSDFQDIVSADSLKKGAKSPGQVTYIIKTHGARILTSKKYVPSVASLIDYRKADLSPGDWEPAIFIDTNGPSGVLKSDGFSAHWPKDQIAGILAGDGDQTSGDGDQTSGDGDQTSGKGMIFSDKLINDSGEHDLQGKMRFGAYSTYNTPHTANGASRIRLPVAGRKHLVDIAGTPGIPKNLIILDSCYGSEKILSALDYSTSNRKNTVVLASIAPLFFKFLDYDALDLAGLFRFPALLERVKKGENLTADEARLAGHMSEGTLSSNVVPATQAYKKLTIWVD